MSYHRHVLAGCTPEPLAHYLKALGILRLVSEQKDETCRGAWQDDRFVLVTTLSCRELEEFFLEEYQPTAFVSPWNKGSGFFQKSDPGLEPVEKSTASRLAVFRNGILGTRVLLGNITESDEIVRAIKARTKTNAGSFQTSDQGKRLSNSGAFTTVQARLKAKLLDPALTDLDRSEISENLEAIRSLAAHPTDPPSKAEAKRIKDSSAYKALLGEADRQFKALKTSLILDCSLTFRGSERVWLDAAMVLDELGEARFPALLGTGGNDGRLDFTNNLMQRLSDLFDLDSERAAPTLGARGWLSSALWGRSTDGMLSGVPVGQYLPISAGGANSTTGADGNSLVNPWDFILMMEGTTLFSSASTKRMNPAAQAQASAPFSLRSHSAGGGTISESEESARGEQWMPLWDRYLTLPELKNFLAEGRAQIGKVSASRPVDMARAISRLGVARGITAFQRYGYLERNGQANFAVPLGRIPVTARPRARLVDEIASWLDRLHHLARAKGAPSRLGHAERGMSDAVFAALTHDDSPALWQAILRAAVGVERLQSTGTAIKAGPIPKLSTEWLIACNDGSAEFRLATALGGAAGGYSKDNGKPFNSLRHHWLPLEDGARRFRTSDKKLAHDVRVVAHGRDPEVDLLAIIERRTIESAQKGVRHPRVMAATGTGACLTDLTAWIAGELDTVKCVELARAFMAVDWSKWDPRTLDITRHRNGNHPEEAWGALRLNALPWPLDKERDIPFDPAIVRRLGAGDPAEAVRLALRRLAAHGIQGTIRFGLGDAALARRWGSALAFPISQHTAHCLLHQLQPQPKETHHDR
jgi:CRISPR-associated protein Csx17